MHAGPIDLSIYRMCLLVDVHLATYADEEMPDIPQWIGAAAIMHMQRNNVRLSRVSRIHIQEIYTHSQGHTHTPPAAVVYLPEIFRQEPGC